MQAPYCNRAKVGLLESLKGTSPAAAISDAETAIRLGPVTADLYFDAARLYALDRDNPRRDAMIVRYLAKALDLGLAPQAVQSDASLKPYLATLADRGSFTARPATTRPAEPILLIPPACPLVDRIPAGS